MDLDDFQSGAANDHSMSAKAFSVAHLSRTRSFKMAIVLMGFYVSDPSDELTDVKTKTVAKNH